MRRTEDISCACFFAELFGNHGEDERKRENRQQNTLRNRSHPIRLLPRRAGEEVSGAPNTLRATATGKYSHIQNNPSQVRSWTGASWRMVCGISRIAEQFLLHWTRDRSSPSSLAESIQVVRRIFIGSQNRPENSAEECSGANVKGDAGCSWDNPGLTHCCGYMKYISQEPWQH